MKELIDLRRGKTTTTGKDIFEAMTAVISGTDYFLCVAFFFLYNGTVHLGYTHIFHHFFVSMESRMQTLPHPPLFKAVWLN